MSITLATEPNLSIIILAAGKGKRMKNPAMAKVMYDLNGKPMIEYVLQLTSKLNATKTLLIVGWQKDSVIAYVSPRYPTVEFVEQKEQLGTGHAVMQTIDILKNLSGDVLILSGDVPLLTEKTTRALIGYHRTSEAIATILTAELNDPTDYGRIVRNKDGSVKKIVEQKDASPKELKIREINSGIYVFQIKALLECLPQITPNNAQQEYYLTDVFEFFWKNKWKVSAVKAIDSIEVLGVNDVDQLEKVRSIITKQQTSV